MRAFASAGVWGSVLVVSLLVVTGCSSQGSRSAAGASESGFPAVSVSGSAQPSVEPSASDAGSLSPSPSLSPSASLSPSGLVVGAGGVPALPRVSYRGVGHALTVVLRPGPGSLVPVSEYLVTLVPRGSEPQPGAGYTECAVAGAGVVETSCVVLAKRGQWDVYVAAVNDAGSSMWVGPSTFDVTSCTDVDAGSGRCEVYDTGPGGGIIFYDAGSRQSWGQYLEVAPKGWSGSADDPKYQWCVKGQPGYDYLETGTAIGAGRDSTQLIIANCGTDTAAGAAAAYTGGGLRDWFLPSKYELLKLYDNARSEAGMCEVFGCVWWSSSQGDEYSDEAWLQHFNYGYLDIFRKTSLNFVRPVRAF